MHRILLTLAIMCAVVVRGDGQVIRNPKPPFTVQDVERGMRLAKLSFDLRNQMSSFANAEEPFKIAGNLYFVGVGNGESYLLMANSRYGIVKVPTAQFASAPAITAQVDKAGTFEPVASMTGVEQLDLLDTTQSATIVRAQDGSRSLNVTPLP